MLIGYARSRYKKSVENQIRLLKKAGIINIYSEADDGVIRGEAIKKLIKDVKPGDQVYLTDMNRLSRDIYEVVAITVLLKKKNVNIKCIVDNDMDTDSFLKAFNIKEANYGYFDKYEEKHQLKIEKYEKKVLENKNH